MPPIDAQWLGQVREDAIDPERPLVDAHHHLWEFPGSTYLAADLLDDLSDHRVEQTVFVECGAGYHSGGDKHLQPVGETLFVANIAGASTGATGIAAGIVGFADLLRGDAASEVLDAHVQASPDRFRGIRHSGAWHPHESIRKSHSDPPPQMYLRDDFRAGFALLAPRGLSFDAWCFHTQLPELADLARAFPDTTIVLDHVGGPLGIGPYRGRRDEVYEDWQAGITALAACANVHVKLGGLGMAISGFGWHRAERPPGSQELAAAWSPWFHHCIERFGTERCVFESNFPVDKVSCSYTVMWNAFKTIAARYSQAQQDAMLHDNATRLYRLGA
ncbi:MAG: amidohydrolase family protein [Halioglobus sp.]|nr:amidohydrolase family protein [Halioglobus sp.]